MWEKVAVRALVRERVAARVEARAGLRAEERVETRAELLVAYGAAPKSDDGKVLSEDGERRDPAGRG